MSVLGPNGTGKSTLSSTIMGDPAYKITKGDILLNGKSIIDLPVDERARMGLFLAMQYPQEIPGVTATIFVLSVTFCFKSSKSSLPSSVKVTYFTFRFFSCAIACHGTMLL